MLDFTQSFNDAWRQGHAVDETRATDLRRGPIQLLCFDWSYVFYIELHFKLKHLHVVEFCIGIF